MHLLDIFELLILVLVIVILADLPPTPFLGRRVLASRLLAFFHKATKSDGFI